MSKDPTKENSDSGCQPGAGELVAKIEIIDRLTGTIHNVLKGKKLEVIEIPADHPDNEIRQLVEYVNKFVKEYNSFSDFMYSMARGELDYSPPGAAWWLRSPSKASSQACGTSHMLLKEYPMAISNTRSVSWVIFPWRSTR